MQNSDTSTPSERSLTVLVFLLHLVWSSAIHVSVLLCVFVPMTCALLFQHITWFSKLQDGPHTSVLVMLHNLKQKYDCTGMASHI